MSSKHIPKQVLFRPGDLKGQKELERELLKSPIHTQAGEMLNLSVHVHNLLSHKALHPLPIPMRATVLRVLGDDGKTSKHHESCGRWGNPTGKLKLETQLAIQYACPEKRVTELTGGA